MNQTLHILKKDIRCFRLEIVLVFLSGILSVRYGMPRMFFDDFVIPQLVPGIAPLFEAPFWITGTLLITRLIHAEAIPGNKVYWLTRPYRWKSLLAGKLLFLFLFVGLPPALVMLVSLKGTGFSFGEFLPSLLFRELMIVLVWIVPVAALATVTESLASFFVGLLFAAALSTSVLGLLSTRSYSKLVAWVPVSLFALSLICGAVVILYIQYKQRWTMVGRVCAVASVLLGIGMVALTPPALGMRVQSLFSRADTDHSAMVVSLKNERTERSRALWLEFEGTPAGFEVRTDALVGSVVGSDGTVTDFSGRYDALDRAGTTGTSRIHAWISDSDFLRLRGKPATVRGSVYVTLSKVVRSSWQERPSERFATVANGIRCGSNYSAFGRALTCWAILGSRGMLSVWGEDQNGFDGSTTMASDSYAPFPSLGLSPYEGVLVHRPRLPLSGQPLPVPIEFLYTEPVSHFRLDFNIPVERFLE